MASKKSPIREYLAEIGRKGGQAKVPKGFAALTEEERQAAREKGLATRRKKAASRKKSK